MKYFFTIIITCFFFLSISCAVVHGPGIKPPNKNYVKVFKEVEILKCAKKTKKPCPIGKWVKTGSGLSVHILKKITTIITAGHVCSETGMPKEIVQFNTTIKVKDSRGYFHDAHVIKSITDHDVTGDLCALYVPTMKPSKVYLAKKAPNIGERVYSIASPVGVYHPPVAPIFMGVYSGQVDTLTAIVTLPATGGSSGAAILNLKNEVVGILFAVNSKFHYITLVSSFLNTKKFFKEVKVLLLPMNRSSF